MLRGVKAKYDLATKKVSGLEQELIKAQAAVDQITEEFATTLGGLDECPVCGSMLDQGCSV